MKSSVFLMLFFAGFLNVEAQNVVYDANAEERKVGKFNSIEVSGTVSLYISQGTEVGVAVSAQELKYNSKIITEVKNGVLKISVEGGMWNGFSWTNRKLKAYVSVTDLNRLQISGASYATITGVLKGQDFQLKVSGASEVKGALKVINFNLGISGASVVRLTGTVENANIDASGAARINAFDLNVENGKFDISGASHLTISVNKELNANASGGSSLQYRGTAVSRNVNANGGATIQKKSGL
jgi:hypothetical protein